MSKVIKGDFGGNPVPNIDKLYDDLVPLLEEMTDIACESLGEEQGCLFIQTLSDSIHKIADKLAAQVEITQHIELCMENGDIVDLTLETNELI